MISDLLCADKRGLYLLKKSIFYMLVLLMISTPLLDHLNGSWSHSAAQAQSTNQNIPNERLAVLMLRNRINMSREEVEYLTSVVRRITSKRLAQSYLIMTQENIEILLPPNTQLEDCVSECQVKTGRTLGARYIITGEVLRFGSSLRLTLRMHDTKTGRLVSSEVAKGKEVEELEDPTEQAVLALIQQIENHNQSQTQGLIPASNAKREKQNREKTSNKYDAAEPSEEVIVVGAQGRLNLLSSHSEKELIVDQVQTERLKYRRRRKSRKERLRARAREAEREREARLAGRTIKRKQTQKRSNQTQKHKRLVTKKSTESTSNHGDHFSLNELYFALARGECVTNNVDCQLDHDASLQLGWSYYGATAKRSFSHWRSGFDIKYAHSSFSDSDMSFNTPDMSFTLNTLTLAYLFNYSMSRLDLQVQIGWGLAFGNQSLADFSGNEATMTDMDFAEWNALNIGLAIGLRISSSLKFSLYSDRFDTLGETEMCDFFSDRCSQDKLPVVTQSGIRLSWTPDY